MSEVLLNQATSQQLVQALINKHQGDYTKKNVASDHAYSANNSYDYKHDQQSKVKGELDALMVEGAEMDKAGNATGLEVISVQASKKFTLYQAISDELEELSERKDAAFAAYKATTGEVYKPQPKGRVATSKNFELSEIKTLLAK